MSYLEKFAQEREKEKTKTFSFRLPESLHTAFTSRCDDLNIKVADALRLLVEREMSSVISSPESHLETNPPTSANERPQNANKELPKVNESLQPVNKPIAKKRARPSRGSGIRFNYDQWKVEGDVPCPVCREWKRSNKITRHIREVHEMDSKEVFSNEEYVQIANNMVKERKE